MQYIFPRTKTSEVITKNLNSLSKASRKLKQQEGIYSREIEARRAILKDLLVSSIKRTHSQKSIFISFSNTGSELAEIASAEADRRKLLVKTGFDDEVTQSDDLSRSIVNQIKSSDCFLAIWTDDFTAKNKSYIDRLGNSVDKTSGFAPSVWMPFELGVAVSNNIPFRLLILNGMHKNYYEKPLHVSPKMVFKKTDFREAVEKSIETLFKKISRI